MSKVRVPVIGTVGKSIRINSNATEGSQIGSDLRLPDGSVPSLAQLAAALYIASPPTIVAPTSSGSFGFVFESEVIDGVILARVADDERITGQWQFDSLTMTNAAAIEWLNIPGARIDLLNFEGVSAPAEVEIDHYSNEVNSLQTATDDVTATTLHTLIPSGTLIDGDDYLVVSKTWYGSETGAGLDDDTDNSISVSYGAQGIVTANMAARVSQFVSLPYYGNELSDASIITADATSALLLKAISAPAPNNNVEVRMSHVWALNLTQLGSDNYSDTSVFSDSAQTTNTVDTWNSAGSHTLGDGVSDYVLFINFAAVVSDIGVATSPDFHGYVRVSGGPWTDAELYEVGDTGQRNNQSYRQVGVLILEAPAAGTQLQFETKWSSVGGFTSAHGDIKLSLSVIALRLNDFVDYTMISSADLADPGGAGEVEVLTSSFTSSATSGDWGFLGGLSSYFPSSSRDAVTEIRADVNSAGDADAAGQQDVAQAGDSAVRMLQAIIPVGTETNVNNTDPVDFGMFVNTAPSVGADEWDAAGMVAFSYRALIVTETFTVGDPLYKTLIDGSEVVIDSTLNVTGATDLDSTLNVDGVADFNTHVDVNGGVLTVYDSSGNDSMAASHDGADFNFNVVNTADVNFTGASVGYFFDNVLGGANSHAAAILNEAATTTNPSLIVDQIDPNTGFGWADPDALTVIAGGIMAVRYSEVSNAVMFAPYFQDVQIAFAGGGQGSATAIKSSYTRFTTVATAGDSARLPSVFPAWTIAEIINDGANAMDIFPASGDDHGAGVDTAVSLLVGQSITFIATALNSTWTILKNSATGGAATVNLGDHADVDTTSASADDLLVLNGSDVWVDTAGALTWSGSSLQSTGVFEFGGTGTYTLNGELRIRNSGATDWLAISHDGVDVTFAGTNTTDLNITGITSIQAGTVDADFDAITGTSTGVGLGTEGAPSRYFEGDIDTGSWSPGANIYAISVGGTEAVRYTGASAPLIRVGMNEGITASTTQTQGQQPLTASWNEVSTVANNDDVVTLPSMTTGETAVIINNGTKRLQVFPASGQDCGAGVDTSVSIKADSSRYWFAYNPGANIVAFDIATDFKNLQGVDTIGRSANDLMYFNGTDWKHTGGNLTFDGTNLSATQIGGIVEANLVDKDASEVITGAREYQGDMGFYSTTPITQQTGVAVTAAGIHAALVNLGLITA